MKIHRAWIMMICATLMIGFSFGLTAMVIAIFLSPIATALNCGMGTVSLHFSFRSIAGLISVPLIVPVFKKCGFRPTLIISTLLGGLTLFAMAHSTSGMMFAVMGVPVTIFTTFTGMQAMFIMLNNWFEKKAGLATAIASCASALATFVFSPILSKHLVNHTWNETMTLMAIIFTVGCLLMAIPMRLTPQEIGLQPYGHEEKGTTASGTSEMLTGLTLTESTKTVPFYILGVVVFAIGFMGAINQQLSAMGYSIGMDAMTVSNAAMFNALGLLIGKPVIGWVRDRFGGFICTLYGCSCGILSCVVYYLAIANGSFTAFYVAQVLAGFGLCLATILPALLTSATFGRKSYGTIFSIMATVSAVGTSAGAAVFGNMYDAAQNYSGVVILCAVILFACIPVSKIVISAGEKLWKK